MSDIRTNTSVWKKRAGDVAVATTLLVALWASYGCGGEDPKTKRDRFQRASPTASATPRVTQAAMVTEEPVPVVQPRRAAVTYEEAESVFRDKQYGEASDLFLIYVSEHPDNVWGHYMLGLSAWKAGVLPQAETSFTRALAIDSNHVKTLVNLSRVYLDGHRPEEALDRIKRVIQIEPESGDAYRLLGRVNDDLGKIEESIEAYERAITLNPDDAWSMNNLGLVLIREERFEEALGPLARAVDLRDDVPVFYNNLGIALERTGNGATSVDAYRRAIELDPGHERAQENLARVQSGEGEFATKTVDLTVLAEEFRHTIAQWGTKGVDTPPNVIR